MRFYNFEAMFVLTFLLNGLNQIMLRCLFLRGCCVTCGMYSSLWLKLLCPSAFWYVCTASSYKVYIFVTSRKFTTCKFASAVIFRPNCSKIKQISIVVFDLRFSVVLGPVNFQRLTGKSRLCQTR